MADDLDVIGQGYLAGQGKMQPKGLVDLDALCKDLEESHMLIILLRNLQEFFEGHAGKLFFKGPVALFFEFFQSDQIIFHTS